jgi:ElaB/YqjD/DUF883 family membrane-anchored ribosome-binding protein
MKRKMQNGKNRINLTVMKKNTDIQESAANLAEDAQALLAATANVAETKVIEARKRLNVALERGKLAWEKVQNGAVAKAKATDVVIRDHPYQAIGIAFGIGALLGLFLRRRA